MIIVWDLCGRLQIISGSRIAYFYCRCVHLTKYFPTVLHPNANIVGHWWMGIKNGNPNFQSCTGGSVYRHLRKKDTFQLICSLFFFCLSPLLRCPLRSHRKCKYSYRIYSKALRLRWSICRWHLCSFFARLSSNSRASSYSIHSYWTPGTGLSHGALQRTLTPIILRTTY